MGRDASQIEQDIEEQRGVISGKLDHLEERVTSDVETSRETIKNEVKSLFGLDQAIRSRLPVVMAGTFGGALALGAITGAVRKRS